MQKVLVVVSGMSGMRWEGVFLRFIFVGMRWEGVAVGLFVGVESVGVLGWWGV